ncbi:MAG: winged helix DNA-binding protein [Chloroflexi bacterium]|nr:winged helix DNA-binding protein [Chloroflexota bacterium]
MGVTTCQWAILEAAFFGNANTLTALARIIPVDAAGISRQLDKLQKSGLVRRRRLRSDRRTIRIELTEAGLDLVPKLAPLVYDNNRKFLSGITTAEQAAFFDIIRKMMQNAGPVTEPVTASQTN